LIFIYFFFFYLYVDHRDLHSFPTRRSSDLEAIGGATAATPFSALIRLAQSSASHSGIISARDLQCQTSRRFLICLQSSGTAAPRSEEHTSELQSRGHLVCRLLLEKKKKKKN